MELSNQHYQAAGFFSSGSIGFLHFEDIAVAIILGYVGALGAWLFMKTVGFIQKKDRK